MRRWSTVTLLTLAVTVGAAAPALAHVTVSTDDDSAGGFAKYTVRVPNERDDASTTEVRLQLPEELEASRVQPLAGWTMELTEGELVISGGSIAPGEFQEFNFQARNPEQSSALAFPAVQVYDSGEEVAWVGEPESDEPAPVVEIVAAGGEQEDPGGSSAQVAELRSQVEQLQAATQQADDPAAATDPLVMVALVLGVLGMVSGGAALAVARRR